jgi:hypothetical protein
MQDLCMRLNNYCLNGQSLPGWATIAWMSNHCLDEQKMLPALPKGTPTVDSGERHESFYFKENY